MYTRPTALLPGPLLAAALFLAPVLLVTPARAQSVPPGYGTVAFPVGSQVSGVVFGGGGAYGKYIYVAVDGAIKRVDPATGAVTGFATGLATGLNRPSGLEFDNGAFGTGLLYVCQNLGSVRRVMADGTHSDLSVGGALFSCNDLAFSTTPAYGALMYVSNGASFGDIVTVTTAGASTSFSPASNYTVPAGLLFPPPGSAFGTNLYVGDFNSGTLKRVLANGTASTFASALGRPLDVEGAQGAGAFANRLYVSDSIGEKIWQVEPNGTVASFATGLSLIQDGWSGDLALRQGGQVLALANESSLVLIGPAASSAAAGTGCGGGAQPPALSVGAPVQGMNVAIQVGHFTPNRAGAVYASLGANSTGTPIGGGCTLFVDQGTAFVLAGFTANAAGNAMLSLPLPRNLDQTGLAFTLQAVQFGTSGPLGMDLSNGVVVTVGF